MSEDVRFKILNTIEQMCAQCVEHVYRSSSAASLTLNGHNYPWNDKVDDGDRREFTRYIYVLSTVHRLVRTRTRMNLRELFYSHVNLFHQQRTSDAIVENIARHLSVERRQLGFVATAKGLCVGTFFTDRLHPSPHTCSVF